MGDLGEGALADTWRPALGGGKYLLVCEWCDEMSNNPSVNYYLINL